MDISLDPGLAPLAYSDINSHRNMIFDEVRNAAYRQALETVLEPGMTVLDLGAGLGIHGLMAARLGAKKVYMVDPSPVVEQARDLAEANGVADRVEVIRGRIEQVDLPEQVDLVVSVLTGNFLLTEDLLPSLFAARDRLLKPGGVLIPGKARMCVALAKAADIHARHVARWSEPCMDVDFGRIRPFAANSVHYIRKEAVEGQMLSPPAVLETMDFARATTAGINERASLVADSSASCHGLIGWFEMQLGSEWISTGPDAEEMHWSMAYLPLDPPVELAEGERVEVILNRPERGEWTWTLEQGEHVQRQSTFNARRQPLNYLKSQAPDFVPELGDRGVLALFVLNAMQSRLSTSKILQAAYDKFGGRYHHLSDLDREVRALIANWQEGAD